MGRAVLAPLTQLPPTDARWDRSETDNHSERDSSQDRDDLGISGDDALEGDSGDQAHSASVFFGPPFRTKSARIQAKVSSVEANLASEPDDGQTSDRRVKRQRRPKVREEQTGHPSSDRFSRAGSRSDGDAGPDPRTASDPSEHVSGEMPVKTKAKRPRDGAAADGDLDETMKGANPARRSKSAHDCMPHQHRVVHRKQCPALRETWRVALEQDGSMSFYCWNPAHEDYILSRHRDYAEFVENELGMIPYDPPVKSHLPPNLVITWSQVCAQQGYAPYILPIGSRRRKRPAGASPQLHRISESPQNLENIGTASDHDSDENFTTSEHATPAAISRQSWNSTSHTQDIDPDTRSLHRAKRSLSAPMADAAQPPLVRGKPNFGLYDDPEVVFNQRSDRDRSRISRSSGSASHSNLSHMQQTIQAPCSPCSTQASTHGPTSPRRSPRLEKRRPFIPDTSDSACRALVNELKSSNPEVFSGLHLFHHFSDEQRKAAREAKKDGYGDAGARGLGARWAHFIELHHAASGINSELDGKLLRYAACYAAPGYDAPAFDTTRQDEFFTRGRSIWAHAIEDYNLKTGFPSVNLSLLKSHVEKYFEYRARMARDDFGVMHDIARASAQQAEDFKKLWETYERRINATKVPGSEAGGLFFDLLYPFFRHIVSVPETDKPSIQARKALAYQTISSAPSSVGQTVSVAAVPSHFGPSRQAAVASHGFHPSSGYSASYFSHPGGVHQPSRHARSFSAPKGSSFFVGRPFSPSVVGSTLGVTLPGLSPCRSCPGHPIHHSSECPLRYFERFHVPCPGFDQFGNRLPTAWNGDSITAPTKAAWADFVARFQLPDADRARGARIDFS